MESALEEIEFLALSANRVAVLRLLAADPRNRTELAEETGASQATLGRILSDFEERSWVRQDGGTYRATATGELVARGFSDLLDILETEQALRDIVEYLPAEELGFDLARLADATITAPTEMRPNAPLQRLLDLEAVAGEIRAFSHAFNEQTLTLVTDRVTAGELSFRGVFSRSAIDALTSESTLRRRLETLLAADGASVRIRDEELPLAGTVFEERTHLLVRDDSGVLRAGIDTDDPAVYAWAEGTFEEYWESATPLDRADLIADES